MTWFETLTGFSEEFPEQVRANITIDGISLRSTVNGNMFVYGELEILTLGTLRQLANSSKQVTGKISVCELIANVQHLHTDTANADSLFQVASQFNLLEMISPNVTPESGVGIYENDFTQGPACAVAAGAGTIYRNYFANVNGKTGQTAENQIDCLADIGSFFGNSENLLWQMKNGYMLPSKGNLEEISKLLKGSSESEIDHIRSLLRIGIQWSTQVTLDAASHRVSQAYCSALPVAYSNYPSSLWADFAKLILEASYEATICAAIVNSKKTGNNKLFLTFLGGGAFGNETDWIIGAIRRVLILYENSNLDVIIVSYGSSKPCVQQLISEIKIDI